MQIKCKRCGYMCEFDPEEGGYMTWCTECNDYPEADIDRANLEWWHMQADVAYKRAKERGYLPWTEHFDKDRRKQGDD